MTQAFPSDAGHSFTAPEKIFASIDAGEAARLVASASDLALVIDAKGKVIDVSARPDGHFADVKQNWTGKDWIDTVATDSRPKVEDMLATIAKGERPDRREINQILPDGTGVPLSISLIPCGPDGTMIALGRDLHHIASLQQSLVNAQLNIEREYSHLRQAEMRYRLLFQVASEAMLVVDAETERVIEVNPAAERIIGESTGRRGTTQLLFSLVDPEDAVALRAFLAKTSASGQAGQQRLRFLASPEPVMISLSIFRENNKLYYLIRFSGEGDTTPGPSDITARGAMLSVVAKIPDAFVVVDAACSIVSVNPAFLNICEIATDAQALGKPLDTFLGRPGVDVSVLLKNLKEHGSVRRFATICRGGLGGTIEVEVAAVSAPVGDQIWYGFTIREASRHPRAGNDNPGPATIESGDNFAALVGRVSLKELVRESTDLIEKRCIEAALNITGGNRASAAEMLGLSRQSLYVKLRRHGIGDDMDGDADA
jgi:transcriptional regulator PpsR